MNANPTRRGTVKSFKSAFKFKFEDNALDNEELFNLAPPQGLTTLTLPQSIPNLDTMPPKLWSWITTSEDGQKMETPILFSPAGETLRGVIPKHLESSPAKQAKTNEISMNSSNLSRKPVLHDAESKYLFVNLKSINLKRDSNGNEVICLIGVEDQKVCSTTFVLSKQSFGPKKFLFGVDCLEGFLFEIPSFKNQVVVSVRLYTQASADELKGSIHSNLNSFKKSSFSIFNGLSRSGTVTSKFAKNLPTSTDTLFHNIEPKVPADPTLLGVCIGEYSMVIPTTHAFSKLDMTYPLTCVKKNIGKVFLSLGMTFASEYVPMIEIPPSMHQYSEYLNFYLLTPGGLIWDKKWVSACSEGLAIYNISYRENSDPIQRISYRQLQSVGKANREFMAAPFGLELKINIPWQNECEDFKPSELSDAWKDQVAEAGIASLKSILIYITADDEARMNHWKAFLHFHIERNAYWRRK